jgi:hypothetical protein
MGDQARVNGILMGWSSLKLKIEGEPFTGIKSIDYGDSVEQAFAYGMGRHYAPRGRTRGKYVPDPLVIEAFEASAGEIMSMLANKAGARGLSNVPVTITIQYIEKDESPVTVEALECTFVKNEVALAEGPDPSTRKVTFQPMRYLRNGVALYDTTEAGA